MSIHSALSFCVAVALASLVQVSPAAAGRTPPPVPGKCAYIQPGVKVCSALLEGEGAFDIYTAMPAVLYVRMDEAIVRFVPPDPRFFQADHRENTVVLIPTQQRLPETTPTIISTKALTVTLNLHRAGKNAPDTQVTIADPGKGARTAEVSKLVADAEKAEQTRVAARLRDGVLDDLSGKGCEVRRPRGHRIQRNSEFIVARIGQLVRFGSKRYLTFSIQNRGGEPFDVRAIKVLSAGKDAAVPWRLAAMTIMPSEEASGALELPGTIPIGSNVTLRFEEAEAKRSVEIADVGL